MRGSKVCLLKSCLLRPGWLGCWPFVDIVLVLLVDALAFAFAALCLGTGCDVL